jgi:glycosyltransferase involved in cell wall biosynthesis
MGRDVLSPDPKSRLLLVGNFLSHAGFSPSTCEILAGRLREEGHQVYATSTRTRRFLRLFDMLLSAFRWRANYDLAYVEVYSGLAFMWASAVGRLLSLLNKPYVLALHGGRLPHFATEHPKQIQRLLGSAQAVVAPSGYLGQGLKKYCSDIREIPNGIDLSLYSFSLRRHVRPRLVWLRAFHEIYNPTMAVSVLADLYKGFPEVTLKMIGSDKDGSLAVIRTLAEELGVDEHLVTPGKIDKSDVPRYLCKGDIFLNTTNIDNTPVSVIEAMACGLCIVSTNVGGIPYLLEHNKTALLVDPNDAKGMSAAVSRLLTEPGLAQELSANARSRAEQFDWDVVLPQWLELFDSVSRREM